MPEHLTKILSYLDQLSLAVESIDKKEGIVIVSNPEQGICNLILDCEDPILVLEQLIYPIKNHSQKHFFRLLQINRSLVHGAFCLDDEGKYVIFRDTLQLENLDLNEIEASIRALSLAMAEFSSEFLLLNQV